MGLGLKIGSVNLGLIDLKFADRHNPPLSERGANGTKKVPAETL